MKLHLELFVRAHPGGGFTAELVGRPEVSMFHVDEAEIRETLGLLIGDRIERSHPRAQAGFTAAPDAALEVVEGPELLPVHGREEVERAPMRFSVLVAERQGWRSLHFPRLDLHAWLPRGDEDWRAAAGLLLEAHLRGWSDRRRLVARMDGVEWVEPLELDVRPPSLSDFSGRRRDLDELPARRAEKLEPALTPSGKKRPPTPQLEQVALPFHRMVAEGRVEPGFGRETEVERLRRALSGPPQAVAVVGPPGVGKSAVIDEALRRLVLPFDAEERPRREVWLADASRLVAVRDMFSDWQRQTLDVAKEVEDAEAVWAIGPLLPLLDAGKHVRSEQNVAQLLGPTLAEGRVVVVGEASEAAWTRLEQRNPSFARAFTVLRVAEPDAPSSDAVAAALAEHLRSRFGVRLDASALSASRRLARRYASADTSPFGHRLALLRRAAAAAAATRPTDETGELVLGEAELLDAFADETGLPRALLRDDLPLDLGGLRSFFEARLIGQPRAVDRLVDLVSTIKSGLSELGRPLGSFLFVGPTGVGKTEAAKALATYLFGGPERLVRFDMSELSTPDAVRRFVGDEAAEGQLVAAVRKQPFCVVLLDEVEKAHPMVFDLLLQVLGEARLTDAGGRRASFDNAAVIMTSNLGVGTARPRVGFGKAESLDLEAHFRGEVERFFRPELVGRIDHLVPFSPLSDASIRVIADGKIDALVRREGLRIRDLELVVAPEVRAGLARAGVDPKYGARPLERALESRLAGPLAEHLARATPPPGSRLVAALPAGGSEGCTFAVELGGERSSVRGPLGATLEAVGALRFRLGRWRSTRELRELEADVRLLDRLGRVRAFWEDRAAAEARMRGIHHKQAQLRAWSELERDLDALEDLALEAWFAGDPEPGAELEHERVELLGRLTELEGALYDQRFDHPGRAWLFLRADSPQELLRDLLEAYLQLAVTRGWSAWAQEPLEIEDPAADGGLRRAWTAAEAVSLERDDAPRWWSRRQTGAELLLRFEGPRAAALLLGDRGRYTFHGARGTETAHVLGLAEAPEGPDAAPLVRQPFRTINERSDLVTDHHLELHRPLEPRWSRPFERFAQARVLRDVFGEAGLRWARRWERVS